MSTLLLVHGGWAASWAWDKVLPELAQLGVAAQAVNLPGRRTGRRRMWSISLDDCSGALINAADAIDGPVTLVGHSAGGFFVTAAAGRSPESFQSLVYLAGFVPVEGERLFRLAMNDKNSLLGPGVKPKPFSGSIALDPSVWHDALFHDCHAEDETLAAGRFEDEPIRPGITRIRLKSGFESIPKRYVLCKGDRAITPDYQRWMADRSNVPITDELPTGHMPISSAPAMLAGVLATCAA